MYVSIISAAFATQQITPKCIGLNQEPFIYLKFLQIGNFSTDSSELS